MIRSFLFLADMTILHEPIDPADCAMREEPMKAVRASIASELPEWMRG